MLLPTSVDVLRCVERTLETVIVPTLTSTTERSAAATIRHLLRHVVLRIEHEGQLLAAEIELLRPLLEQAQRLFQDGFADDPETERARAGVAEALQRPAPPQAYRDVVSLAAEVTALRRGVCDALALIQRDDAVLTGPVKHLYEGFKRYITWELDSESQLIDPAFEGYGPRR